jgi:hypothetical protein
VILTPAGRRGLHEHLHVDIAHPAAA